MRPAALGGADTASSGNAEYTIALGAALRAPGGAGLATLNTVSFTGVGRWTIADVSKGTASISLAAVSDPTEGAL